MSGIGMSSEERAQLAVSEFNKMRPTLTGFARALTGKHSISVVANMGATYTDEHSIYIEPPLSLADRPEHNLDFCHVQDGNGVQICAACKVSDEVLFRVYHEIAHIWGGSFADLSDADRGALLKSAIERSGVKISADTMEAIERGAHGAGVGGIIRVLSPWVQVLWNALEDARVNDRMGKARPGIARMRRASEREIIHGETERFVDGEIKMIGFGDNTPDYQAAIGLYIKASGDEFPDKMLGDVRTALMDSRVDEIVNRELPDGGTTADSLTGAVEAYLAMREHGFFGGVPPQEEEPEPDEDQDQDQDEPESEPGEPDDQDDESDASLNKDPQPSDKPEGDESEDDQHEADPDDGEGAGDPSEVPGDSDGEEDQGEAGGEGPSDVEGEDEGDGGSGESGDSDTAQSGEANSDEMTGDGTPGDTGSGFGSGTGGTKSEQGNEVDSTDPSGDGDEVPAEGGQGEASDAPGGDSTDAGGDQSGDSSQPSGETVDGEGEGEALSADDGDDGPAEPQEPPQGRVVTASDPSREVEADAPVVRPTPQSPEEIAANAEAAMKEIEAFFGHHKDDETLNAGEPDEDVEALARVLVAMTYFDILPRNVDGVRIHTYRKHVSGVEKDSGLHVDFAEGWTYEYHSRQRNFKDICGIDGDFVPSQAVIGKVVSETRAVFAENQRSKEARHLRSGRVDGRVLGKRAPIGDPRLFAKRTRPGKRSYKVVIGGDISGSTKGKALVLIKRAIMAQAEVLSRVGVPFEVWLHSAGYSRFSRYGFEMNMYVIKGANQPWNDEARKALMEIGPDAGNLDGHTVQFYRKLLDNSTATDRILMYYTDGAIPALNGLEEGKILTSEIETFKKKGYKLMCVGVFTDSPKEWGLSTVRVDGDEDLVKVVKHLEAALVE